MRYVGDEFRSHQGYHGFVVHWRKVPRSLRYSGDVVLERKERGGWVPAESGPRLALVTAYLQQRGDWPLFRFTVQ